MLRLILAAAAVLLSFLFYKKHPSSWRGIVFFLFFNWLIIEIVVYGYLLYIVHTGDSLFLIGNQKFLDVLIKKDIIDRIFTQKDSHNSFYQFDLDLGYTVGKDKTYWVYRSNSQGLRSDREYSLVPAPTTLRLAVFGDSFVFCDGEPNESSWPAILEKSFNGLEVMNFGVSGYGLSSIYLRYIKEGLQYSPDVVFFNYITFCNRDWIEGSLIGGTTLRESTLYHPLLTMKDGNVCVRRFTPLDFFNPALRDKYIYKPFGLKPSEHFWKWPFFSFTNTGLALKDLYFKNKFPQAFKDQYSDPQLMAKRLLYNEKIIEDFLDVARKQHSSVIFFGEQAFNDLPKPIQGILLQHSSNVVYIDGSKLLKTFFNDLKLQPKDYLNSTNHYNVLGNHIYATALGMILKNYSWGRGKRVFKYCAKTNRFQNVSLQPCQ